VMLQIYQYTCSETSQFFRAKGLKVKNFCMDDFNANLKGLM
jgi:hypothetical protein